MLLVGSFPDLEIRRFVVCFFDASGEAADGEAFFDVSSFIFAYLLFDCSYIQYTAQSHARVDCDRS